MKIDVVPIATGPMVLTGSKVLELIQDEHTPPLDLLVRETIQNSADAILETKDFGKIMFKTGTFGGELLASSISGEVGENMAERLNKASYSYLAIMDYNTCGLLGKPEKSYDEDNNLYNLVYDVMNHKNDSTMGGSHGIGKSVYYRYGVGICFFYSRTYENGDYVHKLAGALIQDENKDTCFLGKRTSGIAYFGAEIGGKPVPIYDESVIKEFLSVFGLEPYSEKQTGTCVIIPYIDQRALCETIENSDDIAKCFWTSSLEDSLKMAIQRWYFARLDNESFHGKSLRVGVNGVKVELNPFFTALQKLYNGTIDGCEELDVTAINFSGISLGKFRYKMFKASEIGMTPPNNYPSPKFMTDSPYDVDKNGLLFYMRKPGMAINYQNKEFGQSFSIGESEYLIGVFVLNDDVTVGEAENLGAYMRKSEEANHKEWRDIKNNKFPVLSKRKPFKHICGCIASKLMEKFGKSHPVSIEGASTPLQKKLGKKLLPPSGFGNDPEPPTGHGGSGSPASKKSKVKIEFSGAEADGSLNYEVQLTLKPSETARVGLEIRAGGKRYSFDKWEKTNFRIPCELKRIDIKNVKVDGHIKDELQNLAFNDDFPKRQAKKLGDEELYKVRGFVASSEKPFGLGIQNCTSGKMTATVALKLSVNDNKFTIGFNANVNEVSL